MTKNKRHQHPLRTYFLKLFMILLLVASVLAMMIVGILREFIFPEASHGALALSVCVLTMAIGGLLMWAGASHLTKPIAAINDAVNKIAQGNFDVRVDRKNYPKDKAPFRNELDELSKNVNYMAEKLKEVDQMRQDFISNLSHELKTPIAAIAGLSELLLDHQTDAETKQTLLTLLKDESERLNRLCEGILDLSRLDYDDYETQSVRIDEQIRHAMILLTEKWTDKTITMEWDGDVTTVNTVPDLTMLIWTNLIDNAIKYSSQQVEVSISCHQQENGALVHINDKGKGMTTEQVERMFEQFYQADSSHKASGYGIGLALVKKIIHLLGGKIHVTSQLGKGTHIEVFLPNKAILF
ncbi:MAG: HAMP domain-containing sensor histidine kinase [Aerococcaceae bacterium]|nr:HAMP domain-containing sensor histidine kinase [Aerococcaceae bacterium]